MPDANLAAKSFYSGTHRFVDPSTTLDRVQSQFWRFGITRVANLTGLDRIGIPVVMVCRPNARSSAVFHGKGLDLPAAKASGVMEAIETWHAENADLPLRFGSYGDLGSRYQVCDINALPRLKNGDFNPERPLLWVEGINLVGDTPIWVPFELVHANSSLDGPPSNQGFASGTNGLASGNHLLEAMSHALCEVIERDATALWRNGRTVAREERRVDLSSVDDPACCAIIDRLADAHFDTGVWNVTTDLGVPAFQCLILDRLDERGHIGSGAGCHPAREIALLRALTEAAQVRMTYILGSREDIITADYDPETLKRRNISVRDMLRGPTAQSFSSIEGRFFTDFESEVQWIVNRAKEVGFEEVIAVDLTKEDLLVPVVRVLVPGLEGSHHHPGYTKGARARAASAEHR